MAVKVIYFVHGTTTDNAEHMKNAGEKLNLGNQDGNTLLNNNKTGVNSCFLCYNFIVFMNLL